MGGRGRQTLSADLHVRLAIPTLQPANSATGPWPQLAVESDDPFKHVWRLNTRAGQSSKTSFFAMGSGPMRAKRGKEHVLTHLKIQDSSSVAVGVLECDRLPMIPYVKWWRRNAALPQPAQPVRGTNTIFSRYDTSRRPRHRDVAPQTVRVGIGFAYHRICPWYRAASTPGAEFVQGIGRTNDAILYGGHVTLWLQTDDTVLQEIGPRFQAAHPAISASHLRRRSRNMTTTFTKSIQGSLVQP